MAKKIIMFCRYYVPPIVLLPYQTFQFLYPKLSFQVSRASNHHFHNLKADEIQTHVPIEPKLSSSFITDSEIQYEFAHHAPGVARMNNGSFGCCPASIISDLHQWQLKLLRQPDHFYLNELQNRILESRTVVKDLINAEDVDEVSIVDNVSTAVAIVLQQTAWAFAERKFNKGDAVIMFHCAYGAVKNSIKAYFLRAGGEESVEQVLIDAAHAVGCIDVDMQEIGADFYTSNLYKWFFCPPAVAFLYCRKSENSDLQFHHPVVSHEYGNGLAKETGWVGTRDYSPYLVLPSVMEFVNRFEGGVEGIRKMNHDAVVEMGKMLAEAWGTNLGCPPDMCASMIMVGLPACLGISSDDDAIKLWARLCKKFGVEVKIHYQAPKDAEVVPTTGYVRICHQIYNKVDDYYKLRDAINQLVRDGFTCALVINEA